MNAVPRLYGDGVGDDTAALQQWLDEGGAFNELPSGTYRVAGKLWLGVSPSSPLRQPAHGTAKRAVHQGREARFEEGVGHRLQADLPEQETTAAAAGGIEGAVATEVRGSLHLDADSAFGDVAGNAHADGGHAASVKRPGGSR